MSTHEVFTSKAQGADCVAKFTAEFGVRLSPCCSVDHINSQISCWSEKAKIKLKVQVFLSTKHGLFRDFLFGLFQDGFILERTLTL